MISPCIQIISIIAKYTRFVSVVNTKRIVYIFKSCFRNILNCLNIISCILLWLLLTSYFQSFQFYTHKSAIIFVIATMLLSDFLHPAQFTLHIIYIVQDMKTFFLFLGVHFPYCLPATQLCTFQAICQHPFSCEYYIPPV